MLAAVDRILDWVKRQDHEIIVGDAKGVDQHVVTGCILRHIPFVCVGITQQPRAVGAKGEAYRRCEVTPAAEFATVGEYWKNAYLERDRIMVQLCDRCVAIWNGKSTGTIYTFKYALSEYKAIETDLRTFNNEKE